MPVVHLIRHGQASFGAADYDVLSDTGHRQAELLAESLVRRGVRPDRVAAGTLNRQRDTATACAAAAAWALPVAIEPRFDEYDHIGLLRQQEAATNAASDIARDTVQGVQESLDAALLDWIRSARPSSDGRTFGQWRDDAVTAQRDLLDSLGRGGSALIFTSGGVIAAICADLLGLGPEGVVALNRVTVNTGITKLVSGRAGISLISFNDHGHLEGTADLLTYR